MKAQAVIGALALVILSNASGAAPNEQNLNLAYQMQEAVLKTQSLEKVRGLLNEGVDINAPIGCGTFNPLDGAVSVQNVEMLKLLLERGAKPLGRQLAAAAFASDSGKALEMSKALLKAGVDPNTPGEPITALTGAVFRGHREVVELLLAQPSIKPDQKDVDGYTALKWATEKGYSDLAATLSAAESGAR